MTSPLAAARRIGWFGRLIRARRAAAALEFAIVALPFLTLAFGAIEVGYDLFVQAVLDSVVEQAARGVQTGTQQGTTGESDSSFAAAAVCPAANGLLNCSQIVVAVQPVPSGYNYYTNINPPTLSTAAASGSVCTGIGGQLMVMQAWYLGPTFAGALIPAFSTTVLGKVVHLTTSSVAFTNEYFTGGQTAGAGC